MSERVRDLSEVAPPLSRPARPTTPSTCSASKCPAPVPVTLAPREHLRYAWLPWREAAASCFSWSNRAAIEALPESRSQQGIRMNRISPVAMSARSALCVYAAHRGRRAARRSLPVVIAIGVGHAECRQRPHARVAARGGRQRRSRARRRPRSTPRWARRWRAPRRRPGIEVTTSGYSSYQVTEKNQPARWRVDANAHARRLRLRARWRRWSRSCRRRTRCCCRG